MLSLNDAQDVVSDDGGLYNSEAVDVPPWALPLKVAAIPVVFVVICPLLVVGERLL